MTRVVVQYETHKVLGCSNTVITGSNPTWGLEVCLHFSVLPSVVLCKKCPCCGLIFHSRSLIQMSERVMVKVKLSLCITKNHAMKTYPILN
jgi:hypothetical protein